ncbi:MAG TPA: hypothetical protein VMQ67_06060 [Candidatus Saccharimonadales bacterium]|jgi:hypothetical protein|nr:hypothetical protein [Candidatus Saccharimonadales bacterium]
MKIHNPSRLLAALAVAATLATRPTPARAEDAGTVIDRKGSYSTSNGASGTASSSTALSKGAANTKGTWTNAAGGTGTWQSERNWNRSTKTGTFSGTATRPNGATSTWQGTSARTAPGVISSGGTITLANGKVETFKSTDTRVAPGAWDKQQVITTAGGKTIDRTVDTTVAGGNGTVNAKTTLPNGQTVSGNGTFTQTIVPAPPPGK